MCTIGFDPFILYWPIVTFVLSIPKSLSARQLIVAEPPVNNKPVDREMDAVTHNEGTSSFPKTKFS